jgi:cell wall-associated NlpC family hydrolase
MKTNVDGLRERVVEVAKTWMLTPYHHMGRIKHAGVDCLTLLAEVYGEAGVIEPIKTVSFYPPDWNLHRDDERYMRAVLDHSVEISGPPKPGDIAIYRFGRAFAHGVIVVEWPRFIHAYVLKGVVYGSHDSAPVRGRQVRFFSPFEVAS